MAELVNLNRARKRRAKNEAETKAEINRVKFGRTRTERNIETAKAEKATKALDQHELPRGDAT